MTNLSVNLNKVALLRNSRTLNLPSVLWAAETCIAAGAYGITVHPRPDERHIRRNDAYELAELLQVHPGIEFNIEGNPLEAGYMEIVRDVRPTQATLVPDNPEQFTSDHGWEVERDRDTLQPIVRTLRDLGIRVSLFVDPVPQCMPAVKALGADRVELYTEPYATAYREGQGDMSRALYADAAEAAQAVGLGVNAGHDLNLSNLPQFLTIPDILEVSIGHALTADALEMGLTHAVRAYLDICKTARVSVG
ncbi:MAG: pyridoxine 5'-phosphate synthase [Cyanobacteria bacterium P01_D01_bin.123]